MKERLIYGLLAAAIFITLLLLGSPFFLYGILIMAIIGYFEFVRIHGMKKQFIISFIGALTVALIVVPWGKFTVNVPSFETIVWLLMFILMGVTVLTKNKTNIKEIAPLFLGAVYIGIGFHYMIVVRELGLYWSLLVFAVIWASDIGAYLSGRWFGKHKLWPAISPNKTREGAIGGIILSLIVALIFAVIKPELLSWSKALQIGLVAAVLGQIGDLIQSAYKRSAGVKDSGKLIPGHGGILDRCDSWIIVFPFLYYFVL